MNQTGTARNGSSDARYTKEQMLAIYRSQKETRTLDRNIDQLFQGPWDYASRNGLTSSKDGKDQPGPEVCWNASNDGDPFGMVDMSDAERQVRNLDQKEKPILTCVAVHYIRQLTSEINSEQGRWL